MNFGLNEQKNGQHRIMMMESQEKKDNFLKSSLRPYLGNFFINNINRRLWVEDKTNDDDSQSKLNESTSMKEMMVVYTGH